MEFLGAPDPATNIPAHLGIEIVDVVEQPVPGDEHVDIGDRVPDRSGDEGEVLRGRVANQPEGEDFVFRHIRQVGGQDVGELEGVRFFARKETSNLNDIVMWWLQEGIEGILWPHSYIRYDFDWPVDTSRFSHYIRPLVANEEEAKTTAVVLNGEEVPTIEYQDPLDQPRAFIIGDFRFYSYLTPDYPSHRTLLRFLDGNEIKFERVFSWLDEALKDRPVEQHLTATGIQPSLLYEAFDGDDGLNGLDGLHGILISGDIAYIAGHDEKSVSILDISDPSAPQELAIIRHGVSYGAGTWELDGAIGLALNGDFLFVAARISNVVTIINVSIPASPSFVARIKDEVDGFAKLNQAKSVSVQGTYLFIGSGTDDAVTVVDISTPSAPSLVNEIEESAETPGLNGIYQVTAQGNYLYVSGQASDSFAIYEISGNGELSFEGIALHGSEMFNDLDGPRHFALDGTIAYVAARDSGAVPVLDVSDPKNPKLLSVIENGRDGVTLLDAPFGIVVADSTLHVAAQTGNALLIFDVADPSNPRFLTEVQQGDLGTAGLGGPTFVAVDESNIYVAGRGNDALTLFNTASLLQDHLAAGDLGSSGNSVAIDLESYDLARDTFFWADTSIIPRVVEETVYVADRIAAPDDELGRGEGETYMAGYLNIDIGDSYNPNAYIDPFEFGFTEANFGAIIPVNAIPGDNRLEVLWFRANDEDTADSFSTHFWPAVLGRYTIEWPVDFAEIILAGNDGTGPLPSLLATGAIYYQNDPTQPGSNPNEEHALMQGGQGFALRDDLNITTNDEGEYSSDPFVLIEYLDFDSRVSMEPFKVLREKPSEGITFTYDVEAPTVIQAPMPLPLLELPLDLAAVSGAFNVNTEVSYSEIAASNVDGNNVIWSLNTIERPQLAQYSEYNLQSPDLLTNQTFYVLDASYDDNTVSGVITEGELALASLSAADGEESGFGYGEEDDQNPIAYFTVESGAVVVATGDPVYIFSDSHNQFESLTVSSVAANDSTTVIGIDVPASMRTGYSYEYTVIVDVVEGGEGEEDEEIEEIRTSQRYVFEPFLLNDLNIIQLRSDLSDGDLDAYYLARSPLTASDLTIDYELKYTFEDRKGNLWVYRGPHTEQGPADSHAFDMKFYYKTLESFYFPGEETQPAVGTLAPFLRSLNADGSYSGDPFGAVDQANVVTYRPFWPDSAVLFTGESLTLPKRGLPAMRGQSSAEILYEQSENQDTPSDSLVLHDPTREKEYFLSSDALAKVPGSAATQNLLGKTFFTLLPPHLVERFFYDPNRGSDGALVFMGEFVDAVLGDDYLLLNVLSASDADKLKALVIADDEDKDAWDTAIEGLATTVEIFEEDIFTPGTYFPNVGRDTVIAFDELVEIRDDDAAVDSYALSATGPGRGYVTLLFGNGEAFTPVGDPVSMSVIKVSSVLYRGEVKPILSNNPLSEMVTMQQVADLAAKTDEFVFAWNIASPVDGFPPVVTLNQRQLLLGESSWNHLRFPTRFNSGASILDVDASRFGTTAVGSLTAVEAIPFTAAAENVGEWEFTLDTQQDADLGDLLSPEHRVTIISTGDALLPESQGARVDGILTDNSSSSTASVQLIDAAAYAFTPEALEETSVSGQPVSIVYRQFDTQEATDYSTLYVSLDLDSDIGVRVFLNGEHIINSNTAIFGEFANTPTAGAPADFLPLSRVYQIGPDFLELGSNTAGTLTHTVAVELFSEVDAGTTQSFNLKVEAYERIDLTGANWLALSPAKFPDGVRTVIGETADVRALADNYVIMRYRPIDDVDGWSDWTAPALAEGWIKRVLAGINPFNQRVSELFSNTIDTDASILQAAGKRWEGDIALNLDTINDFGLIEIYETVLNRGRMLSIDAGINYGPANDALLLVVGYLNDLYLLVGNEAKADALNPTIGIGTADNTYGDIATSMFSFEGQVSTLLEEELALWRGRDDFFQPGVEISPVYNRLVWNFTRGIDAGEVIYALNYNIQEDPTGDLDGEINAADAAEDVPARPRRRLWPLPDSAQGLLWASQQCGLYVGTADRGRQRAGRARFGRLPG